MSCDPTAVDQNEIQTRQMGDVACLNNINVKGVPVLRYGNHFGRETFQPPSVT